MITRTVLIRTHCDWSHLNDISCSLFGKEISTTQFQLHFRRRNDSIKAESSSSEVIMTESSSMPTENRKRLVVYRPSIKLNIEELESKNKANSKSRDLNWDPPDTVRKKKEREISKEKKANYTEHTIARHRSKGMTKIIKKKTPLIDYAADKIRKSNGNDVEKVMEEIADKIDAGATYVIMNDLQRNHDCIACIKLFKWIKRQPWHRPTHKFYNMMISFLGREKQVDLAVGVFLEMLFDKETPNSHTFNSLISAYGRSGKFFEALAVFEYMRKSENQSCRPDESTCNILISALCREKKFELVFEIIYNMKNNIFPDCRPNVFTYNTLLDAICREGLYDSAMELFSQMESENAPPDVVTFNTMINFCCKLGDVSEVEKLLEAMKKRGIEPNTLTYTPLIDLYAKLGDIEKAESTFQIILNSPHLKPDVFCFTSIILCYAQLEQFNKVEELFNLMFSLQVPPNQVTYLNVIYCYGRAGLVDKAEQTFSSLISSGLSPNTHLFSALISAYGRAGLLSKLISTFNQMRRNGYSPNLITYSAMLDACCRSSKWEDTLFILNTLQKSGREWVIAMCRLITGSVQEEEFVWKKAEVMFHKLQSYPLLSRRSLYNNLINVLWIYGLRERSAKVAEIGRSLGVYDMENLFRAPEGDLSEWLIDLHDNSPGSAATHCYAWLTQLRTAWKWKEEIPKKITIVTGWGKHGKGKPARVKSQILAELATMGGPFVEDPENCGRLMAHGEEVKKWLLNSKIERKLILKNEFVIHSYQQVKL